MGDKIFKKVLEGIKKKWNDPDCPMCGHGVWSISNHIYELREYREGRILIFPGEVLLPVVQITCSICGYTIFLDGRVAGVVDEQGASCEVAPT